MYDAQQNILQTRRVSETGVRGASVTEMPGREVKDAELMNRIITQSDKSALQDIALHYGPRLKSFLMARGEDSQTAEDVVQDIIIAVWTKAAQFDASKGTFSAWVYRMTRNKWIDHKRKHKRVTPMAPDILSALSDDIVEPADIEFERAETSAAVRQHMAALPTQQKQMLYLSFFEGLSHNQIAQRTGLPLGTVKGRIRASLKKMRYQLETISGVIK